MPDKREADERALCLACVLGRLHEPGDWRNHPMAGHGYTPGSGWSHPLLVPPEVPNA